MTAYDEIARRGTLRVPDTWTTLRTIDMHTGGEPVRVVVDGWPRVEGATMLERRRYVRAHHDHLRTALMFEPRGHADMYGVLPLPPERADSDFGVLFLHNEGYSTMCGHATLAVAKLAVEQGWVAARAPQTEIVIDAPCGQLRAYAQVRDGKVVAVQFDNVPSFVVALDETVEVPRVGTVRYDLAYGGAFYAYVDATALGLRCVPAEHRRAIDLGMAIKRAVTAHKRNVVHPFAPDLSFLYGTIFVEPAHSPGAHSRNLCVFAAGEVDRSATGSGVSGRAAILHRRGELRAGQTITIESLLGSTMTVRVVAETTFGPHEAIVPRVGGTSHHVGEHRFVIDPDDPLRDGFLLR